MSRKVVHEGMNYPSGLVNVVLFLAHILDVGLVYHSHLYWFALTPKCVLSYEIDQIIINCYKRNNIIIYEKSK